MIKVHVDEQETVEYLLGTVMSKAAEVNRKTHYCVFVYFSGHVNKLEIEVCPNKALFHEKIVEKYIFLKHFATEQQIKDMIKRYIAFLENILETGEVHPDLLEKKNS